MREIECNFLICFSTCFTKMCYSHILLVTIWYPISSDSFLNFYTLQSFLHFHRLIVDKFHSLNHTTLYSLTLLITSNFTINLLPIFIDGWTHKYGHNPIVNSCSSTFLILYLTCHLAFVSNTRFLFKQCARKS